MQLVINVSTHYTSRTARAVIGPLSYPHILAFAVQTAEQRRATVTRMQTYKYRQLQRQLNTPCASHVVMLIAILHRQKSVLMSFACTV